MTIVHLRHMKRRQRIKRGRDWSGMATNQGRKEIICSYKRLGDLSADFPLEPQEGEPGQHPAFGLLTFATVRE